MSVTPNTPPSFEEDDYYFETPPGKIWDLRLDDLKNLLELALDELADKEFDNCESQINEAITKIENYVQM